MQKSLLYYEVHGTQGPYLLLVHGLLSSRAQWIPNIDELSTFCRPVILELFGHGRSPSPKDPDDYAPDNYVREFERVRNELRVDRWFICGQSLGASMTLRYALHHPERIIAQVFTNSRSALTDESYEGMAKAIRESLNTEGRRIIDHFPVHPARSRRMPPDIKAAMVADADLIDVRGFGNTLMTTVALSSVRNMLDKTRVPTLMIVGRYDKAFAKLQAVAEECIPDLKVQEFEGGHAVNIDAAEGFNAAVRDFILGFGCSEPGN